MEQSPGVGGGTKQCLGKEEGWGEHCLDMEEAVPGIGGSSAQKQGGEGHGEQSPGVCGGGGLGSSAQVQEGVQSRA